MPEEVKVVDFGGEPISWTNLLDKDVFNYLNDLNPSLGTEKDPNYREFQEFIQEIDEQEISIISSKEIIDSSVDNIDVDSQQDVNTSYTRDMFISIAANVAKGLLGMREKPMTYQEAIDKKDENGYVWMGKVSAKDLAPFYDMKKGKKTEA